MMHLGSTARLGRLAAGVAFAALALTACSKGSEDAGSTTASTGTETTAAPAATAPETTNAAAPAAAPAAAAPAPDNTDTVDGTKFASFTGDAAKGKTAFIACQTCHAVQAGVNKIGPSLHGVVGRAAGTVAGYTYSPANKNSGITWSQEKLFQYLENPRRVVPGTKMVFPGISDAQKRADVIAYLASNA
jgi:cytochrome c